MLGIFVVHKPGLAAFNVVVIIYVVFLLFALCF